MLFTSPLVRRWTLVLILAIAVVLSIVHLLDLPVSGSLDDIRLSFSRPLVQWKDVPTRYPIPDLTPLPTGPLVSFPRIQHQFGPESVTDRKERQQRLAAIKKSFKHSWEGYRKHAWLQDEVTPLTGDFKNGFGGWGATLIDSLDTLFIMGERKEFAVAVNALKRVDFSTSPLQKINVFETTIRYLGGLLSAYDISGGKYPILLQKATELGDMLYKSFDTSNRMPITQWDWRNAADNGDQAVPGHVLLAEYGSLSLEFTRLSQLTGDDKYYDAIARITDVFEGQQNKTKIPGLWPVLLDPSKLDFTRDKTYTMGAMADSHYEYLLKQHLMLGGRNDQYRRMYEIAIATAKERLFFKPSTPDHQQILISGTLKRNSANNVHLHPEGQHLTCFVGGMVGMGAKVLGQEQDLQTARQLVDGCLWAYDSMPSGIMPETFRARPCENATDCQWSENDWFEGIRREHMTHDHWQMTLEQHAKKVIDSENLVPGFTQIEDPRFLLRPEAIESVFVMYRITGDKTLQDRAWKIFQAIEKHAKTDIAYASIDDVTVKATKQFDSMESFWTAETLKYFYLIFSEPDVVSLDEYVLNTEAHPLLRPKA